MPIGKKEDMMKLSAPKVLTFWLSLLLGVAGVILVLANIWGPGLWLAVAGLALLLLGNLIKGL
jgi:membrane-bound ClpP family serine protease